LCPTFFFDARFWMLLFRIDEDLARETREGRCPHCGEVLHSASWRRKPRGTDLPDEQSLRFSFCCGGDRCRRRVTPPSLRFLGRKVYVGVMVILVTALRQGPTPRGFRKLEGLLGISRRTIARWQKWWEEIFPTSGFWKEMKDRLSRSRVLPERARSFVDRLMGHLSARSLVRLLGSLALLASGPGMAQPGATTEDR